MGTQWGNVKFVPWRLELEDEEVDFVRQALEAYWERIIIDLRERIDELVRRQKELRDMKEEVAEAYAAQHLIRKFTREMEG